MCATSTFWQGWARLACAGLIEYLSAGPVRFPFAPCQRHVGPGARRCRGEILDVYTPSRGDKCPRSPASPAEPAARYAGGSGAVSGRLGGQPASRWRAAASTPATPPAVVASPRRTIAAPSSRGTPWLVRPAASWSPLCPPPPGSAAPPPA